MSKVFFFSLFKFGVLICRISRNLTGLLVLDRYTGKIEIGCPENTNDEEFKENLIVTFRNVRYVKQINELVALVVLYSGASLERTR